MKKNLLFIFIVFIILTVAFTASVFAQSLPDPTHLTGFEQFLSRLTSWVLGIVMPATVLMSIWAAILLMSAGGNANAIKKGQDTLKWAVIGLVLVILTTPIMNFVSTTVSAGTPEGIISRLISYLRNIGGPLAIAMFIWGGILIMTGMPDKIKQAYQIFIWTSVAVAIIAIATSIDNFILYFLK